MSVSYRAIKGDLKNNLVKDYPALIRSIVDTFNNIPGNSGKLPTYYGNYGDPAQAAHTLIEHFDFYSGMMPFFLTLQAHDIYPKNMYQPHIKCWDQITEWDSKLVQQVIPANEKYRKAIAPLVSAPAIDPQKPLTFKRIRPMIARVLENNFPITLFSVITVWNDTPFQPAIEYMLDPNPGIAIKQFLDKFELGGLYNPGDLYRTMAALKLEFPLQEFRWNMFTEWNESPIPEQKLVPPVNQKPLSSSLPSVEIPVSKKTSFTDVHDKLVEIIIT